MRHAPCHEQDHDRGNDTCLRGPALRCTDAGQQNTAGKVEQSAGVPQDAKNGGREQQRRPDRPVSCGAASLTPVAGRNEFIRRFQQVVQPGLYEPVHARVRAGEADPACTVPVSGDSGAACGGILKSATISFGQSLVAEDLLRAEEAAAACDLLLAVGSTMAVFPAAGVVPVAVRHGAVLIIINGGPTEMDSLADVVVEGSIGACLPAITAGLPPAG